MRHSLPTALHRYFPGRTSTPDLRHVTYRLTRYVTFHVTFEVTNHIVLPILTVSRSGLAGMWQAAEPGAAFSGGPDAGYPSLASLWPRRRIVTTMAMARSTSVPTMPIRIPRIGVIRNRELSEPAARKNGRKSDGKPGDYNQMVTLCSVKVTQ